MPDFRTQADTNILARLFRKEIAGKISGGSGVACSIAIILKKFVETDVTY